MEIVERKVSNIINTARLISERTFSEENGIDTLVNILGVSCDIARQLLSGQLCIYEHYSNYIISTEDEYIDYAFEDSKSIANSCAVSLPCYEGLYYTTSIEYGCEFEWGWVSPTGDIFGSYRFYDGRDMLHCDLANCICKLCGYKDEILGSYSILERKGWLKFQPAAIMCDIFLGDDNVMPLITDTLHEFTWKYMKRITERGDFVLPRVGFAYNKRDMSSWKFIKNADLLMFRKYVVSCEK